MADVKSLDLSDTVAAPADEVQLDPFDPKEQHKRLTQRGHDAEVMEALVQEASAPNKPQKLFECGQIMTTERAGLALAFGKLSKHELVLRHQTGDFGELSDADKLMNISCAQNNSAVRSLYPVALSPGEAEVVWSGVPKRTGLGVPDKRDVVLRVQTEGDRKQTWISVVGEPAK